MTHRITKVLAVMIMALACADPQGPLPNYLGARNLTEVQKGPEARAAIQALHADDSCPDEAFIGRYGDDGATILYLAAFPDPDAARSHLLKMAMALAEGAGGFSPVEFDEDSATPVFRTTGHGAEHLFYRRNRLVIWLQQQTPDSDTEADLLRETFPSLDSQ